MAIVERIQRPRARLVAAALTVVSGATVALAQPSVLPDPQPIPVCNTPSLGCWAQLPNPAVTSVNMITLKTGKVMVQHRGTGVSINQQYQIFDPRTDTFGPVNLVPHPHNMYCSGFAQLGDGRVLFAGGLSGADLKRASLYDPNLNGWTAQPDMTGSRFYPTVITLTDTEVLALDGSGPEAMTPEVYTTTGASGFWTRLFGATYGAPPYDFDLPIYPYTHIISTGSAIYTGSRFSAGTEFTRILDPVFETWSQPFPAADPIPGRSSVMYERDNIMKAGPTQTWTLAATTPGAQWSQKDSFNLSRSFFFLTALPDGKVFASGSVTTPELYDPASDSWQNMKPAAEARSDHSSTVLLSDGRVLTAGPTLTAEVYSPPYLFNPNGTLATRPVITSIASVLEYGQAFKLTSPVAALVDSIRLIRLGAASHSWDMGQRSLSLEYAPDCCNPAEEPGVNGNPICFEGHTCCADGQWACNDAGANPTCASVCSTLAVEPPQHAYQATPGYYYVFILDKGVPSRAAIVKLE